MHALSFSPFTEKKAPEGRGATLRKVGAALHLPAGILSP
jgi:hypothetical protein